MNLQRFISNFLGVFTVVTVVVTAVLIESATAADGILRANNPQAQINLREAPDPNSRRLGYGLVGDRVEILEQVPGADGYTWYQVRFYQSGAVGWIRNDFVRLAESDGSGSGSSNARYQDGYDRGYTLGYRDGQNARRYNSGYHPDKVLQAGSGNPDPDYDRGFRAGFFAGFDVGYGRTSANPSNPNGTLLTFQTRANAVRIFNRGGQTLMNVFDKQKGATWLNSVPVTVEQSQAGRYYRYAGEVTVRVFEGTDGTRTLDINGQVETGS
jgi:hypothetical protein